MQLIIAKMHSMCYRVKSKRASSRDKQNFFKTECEESELFGFLRAYRWNMTSFLILKIMFVNLLNLRNDKFIYCIHFYF